MCAQHRMATTTESKAVFVLNNKHVRETRGKYEGVYLGLSYEWFRVAPRPLYTLYRLDKCVDCGEEKYLHLSGIERILRYSRIHPKSKNHISDQEGVFLVRHSS